MIELEYLYWKRVSMPVKDVLISLILILGVNEITLAAFT